MYVAIGDMTGKNMVIVNIKILMYFSAFEMTACKHQLCEESFPKLT